MTGKFIVAYTVVTEVLGEETYEDHYESFVDGDIAENYLKAKKRYDALNDVGTSAPGERIWTITLAEVVISTDY